MHPDEPINLDEPIVTGLDPQTWCSFVQAQIEWLHSYVEQVEKQIDESAKARKSDSIPTDVEYAGDGYPTVILEEHQGIEGPPDELKEIFEYYFPNLQRRSTLIVLFSFLEHNLDQLCEVFATEQRLNIVHTDLKGNGIDRARVYLRKVIGLPLDNSPSWQEIKRIQQIRNIIVHNDAKLGGAEKDFLEFVDKAICLSRIKKSYYDDDIDEINILEGYLAHVLDSCSSYYSDVNKSIEILSSNSQPEPQPPN